MATSPTVLVGSSAPAPAKLPLVPFVIAIVAGVVISALGLGGLVYYLARSGKLPVQGRAPVKDEPAALPTHVLVLEPLLVNLADAGGGSYLRVALTLRVADKPLKKEEKSGNDGEAVAEVRDTVLTVLGRQTADGLLAPDGKERLKSELKAAFAERDAELKVADVFLTDFLVQR